MIAYDEFKQAVYAAYLESYGFAGETDEDKLRYLKDRESQELGWTKVHAAVVEDYLNGYDPSEPVGSPYRYGNSDIMDEITQITGTEARKRYSASDYQYRVKEGDKEL